MKTRITEPRLAPMVRRIAISRALSFTSMIRLEMMLKAATRMMRVRITNMAIFSSLRASKRFLFMLFQLRVQKGKRRRPWMRSAIRSAW